MESGLLVHHCVALLMCCICVDVARVGVDVTMFFTIFVCPINAVPSYCCAGACHALGGSCVLPFLCMLGKCPQLNMLHALPKKKKKHQIGDHALPQRGFGLSTPGGAEWQGATPSNTRHRRHRES
jgi:hypothetical protein